jgi:hypothetical protein
MKGKSKVIPLHIMIQYVNFNFTLCRQSYVPFSFVSKFAFHFQVSKLTLHALRNFYAPKCYLITSSFNLVIDQSIVWVSMCKI